MEQFNILKLSELERTAFSPIIKHEKDPVLSKGCKLFFDGNSSELFKLIASLTDNSRKYYGLEVDFTGPVVYRDFFRCAGGLIPHIKSELAKINAEDVCKNIYIHKEEPYYSVKNMDKDGSENAYRGNELVVLDFANHPLAFSYREVHRFVNNIITNNEGVTVVFTAPKYVVAQPNEDKEILKATATTIITPKNQKIHFVGRHFKEFALSRNN